jgi:endonuclease/exonuclease/phosphatase family metal-dependent hydrolase
LNHRGTESQREGRDPLTSQAPLWFDSSHDLLKHTTTWTRANAEVMPTIPTRKPARQIDFILSRPVNGWKVVEMKVLDEALASDHRAILAVLEPPATIER